MRINYFALPGLVGLKKLKVLSIKTIVLDELGVSWEAVISDDRTTPLPDARKVLAYFIKKYCGKITTVALGKLMKRDHATILYYFHKVDHFKTYDHEFREKLNRIELKINNHNYTVKHEQNK